LREFAVKMKIPFASKLRKDQLETAITRHPMGNRLLTGWQQAKGQSSKVR
jgi:hypothetical protein